MADSNIVEAMMANPVHEDLKPLEWLIGRWRTEEPASGKMWSGSTFTYREELEFFSFGQSVLNYRGISWEPDTNKPLHLESGFLRVIHGTQKLSFLLAHMFGATTIEEGELDGQSFSIKSVDVGEGLIEKIPTVVKVERTLRLTSEGKLEQLVFLQTPNQPLTEHLKAVYKKI